MLYVYNKAIWFGMHIENWLMLENKGFEVDGFPYCKLFAFAKCPLILVNKSSGTNPMT